MLHLESVRPLRLYLFICLCILLVCVTACRKKEIPPQPCQPDPECTGTKDLLLSPSDKSLIMAKDTQLTFISQYDTLQAVFVKAVSQVKPDTFLCNCNTSMILPKEELSVTYRIKGKDLAWNFWSSPIFGSLWLTLTVSDTTTVFQKHEDSDAPKSVFMIMNLRSKRTRDTLTVRGRTYRQVHVSYSFEFLSPGTLVTECYYSGSFGLIRFRYRGILYELAP